MENTTSSQPGYRQLILTFLRISLLGFGGPNAHLALMLDEVVDRKKWISREHFMHLVAATNLLPGPNSSEVAIHIGFTQRGWRGALATGLAFLLPTLILVTLFSALYFRFGTLPSVESVFWGLKPAILAVILAAGWKLAKTALGLPERPALILLVLATGGVLISLFLGGFEVPAMALGGFLTWGFFRLGDPPGTGQGPAGSSKDPPSGVRVGGLAAPLLLTSSPFASGIVPGLGTLGTLFFMMLGAGSVLFGGGYMLVALIEPFVVDGMGWVTQSQFLDGIALTQAVPGPIVTLVAFVGFAAGGVAGALIATIGIYLPSFAAVLLVAPHLERWRRVEGVRAALKGVNAVVAGAILGVGLTLLPPALPDRWAALLFFLVLAVLVRFRVQALWVVAAGLGAGVLHLILAS
jgi:chromate transporter